LVRELIQLDLPISVVIQLSYHLICQLSCLFLADLSIPILVLVHEEQLDLVFIKHTISVRVHLLEHIMQLFSLVIILTLLFLYMFLGLASLLLVSSVLLVLLVKLFVLGVEVTSNKGGILGKFNGFIGSGFCNISVLLVILKIHICFG
jgi:hypothetical protein